jgi:putative lipoprotein
MALPASAVFEATLEDVSRADARAEVIGRARVESPGNPPIAFAIVYDPARIDPRHRYVVRAWILAGGKLLFFSDQSYPVLTAGHGGEVALTLRRMGVSQPQSTLENTYWKLVRLGEQAITAANSSNEPHLLLHPDTQRVSGSGGCNRLAGGYQLDGEALSFGRMAGTLMACMEGMETERSFHEMLPRVRRARVQGQQLELLDAQERPLARFEARTPK